MLYKPSNPKLIRVHTLLELRAQYTYGLFVGSAQALCEWYPVIGYMVSILLCYRDILGIGCPTDPRLHLALPRALHRNLPRYNLRDRESRRSYLSFWLLSCTDEGTVQERKQKQLPRNLESVFCLPISKLQGEARNLDSARRYLDLEICPGSKIRGEARNLDSGWPAPVFGNW